MIEKVHVELLARSSHFIISNMNVKSGYPLSRVFQKHMVIGQEHKHTRMPDKLWKQMYDTTIQVACATRLVPFVDTATARDRFILINCYLISNSTSIQQYHFHTS